MTRGTATVIATLPPPHTGRTRITELVVNRLRERGEVTVINLASGNVARRRSWRAILALRQLWASVRLVARRAGSGNVYISINGGTAAVLDLPLAIAARASGRRLVVHHHSFRYIETPTALMRAFYRLAGDQVVDVALCPRMARGLEHHYQRTGVRVVPNLVETQPPPHPTIPTGPVKLGHLANLTLEKGVGRAIAAFEHARASGIDVELHLAGPCANPETRQAVEAAVSAWPAAVTYHGPVYDDAKDAFYASLDLFLYPTGYVVEAQPLVLLEALGAGVSVISVERGCIGGMADGSHGSVAICALEDFSSTVSDTAARIASGGPARRAANRDAAVSAASRIRCEASTALSALVDEILAIAPTHQGAA